MTRVAVTGGRGFLGQAVAQHLRGAGYQVTILDRPLHDVTGPSFSIGDATHVIHLAGLLGTDELFDDVAAAIRVNIWGTANVLAACAAAGAGYTGITMPDAFPSIYAATKHGALRMERVYGQRGVPVSRVRAFNVYGPGQKHGPGHPQKIIPTFASRAWAGRPLPVWGDGTQGVDLIDSDQVARVLAAAMAFDGDATFDAGTGLSLSVGEVAQMVLDITGSRAGIQYLPMRRGEVPAKVAASGEGWDRLGWKPQFDVARLEETVQWYRGR